VASCPCATKSHAIALGNHLCSACREEGALEEAQASEDLLDARLREHADSVAEASLLDRRDLRHDDDASFGRLPSPGSSRTFPGSVAFARFVVSAHTTTVEIREWLKTSFCTTTCGCE
jgi:hypothetical protein